MSGWRPPPEHGARPPLPPDPASPAAAARASRPLLGAVLVLGAAALWGSFGLFARALFEYGFSPLELTSVRVFIAFVGAAVVALVVPGQRARMRITLRDAAFFAVYGAFAFASFAYLFFMTVERTTVAVAAALLYTSPAFVVIIARVVWGERIDLARLVALGCVLAGVFAVTGVIGGVLTGAATVPAAAIVTGIGSGLTYGIYTVLSKYATRHFDALTTIFYAFLFAVLALSLVAPPWTALLSAPAAAWPLLLGLGLGPSLLSYFLFLRGLRELTAGTASMLASVEPAMAALFAAALLGEAIDGERAIGVVLIVTAALLLIRRRSQAIEP